ncbi:MAG TPA: GNAT family N-acetyltransferase [Actinomycetota bacterium]|nr:GNAT family N-acetyltransferase [Actinomycetota bacterium]
MTNRSEIIAYARAFAAACAEQTIPIEGALLYLAPSFPRMHDLNTVAIRDAARSFRHFVDAADPLFEDAGLEHRKLDVDDERHGPRLADEASREPGWNMSRLVDMTWESDPGGAADIASELPLEDLRELREREHRAGFGGDDDLIRQFLDRDYVYRRAGNGRFFGVRDEDGVLQSSLNLFRIGRVAEIDDVQTAEAARGRGYARAAVLAAARAARRDGAEIVFLCADEDDWPKDFYARLGFIPAGPRWELLRAP